MSDQSPKQNLLGAQLVEGELNSPRLALDQEGAELISAHDVEAGLKLANWLWFIANHGLTPVGKR
jgi:hypothetical protein